MVKTTVGAVTKIKVSVEQSEKGLSKTLQKAIMNLAIALERPLHDWSHALHPLHRA